MSCGVVRVVEEVAPFVDGTLKEQVRGSVHVGIDDASSYTQIETFFVQNFLILRTVLLKEFIALIENQK